MPINIKDAADLEKVLDRFDGTLTEQDTKLRDALAKLDSVKDIGDKVSAFDTVLTEVKEQLKAGFRKVHFGSEGREEKEFADRGDWVKLGVGALHKAPTEVSRKAEGYGWNENAGAVAKFQDAADELYILRTALKLTEEQTRQTKFYANTYRPALERAMSLHKEAFDTADAGAGLEWVPSEFSTRLWEKVRLELAVAALFDSFTMPRSPYTIPVWLNDLTVYTFAENTAGPPSGARTVLDGLGTTNVTSNRQFSAVGIGCAVYTSRFFQEDSVIEVMPFLTRACVQALRNGLEDAIINGDTTATHQDNDIAAVTGSVAKAWIGLRKAARNSTATFDNSGAKIDTRALFLAGPMLCRARMGKYGVNPADLALVVSPQGFNQLLGVESFDTAASLVAGQGTNVQGQLTFRPYGMQLVVSEFMKENLAATGVNTVGGPNTFTAALVVNRRAWLLGNLRNITLEVLRELYAEYDADAVLVKWRGAFNSPLGTSTFHTGYCYDIGL